MKKIISAVLIACSISLITPVAAIAKTPPEVEAPYKTYQKAMTDGNYAVAIESARKAWKAAESALGDSQTTGDLAFNYGYVEKFQGDPKQSLKALERSIGLAKFHSESAAEISLERAVEFTSILQATGQGKKSRKAIKQYLNFADSNGLGATVFAGELHVLDARACSQAFFRKAKYGNQQVGSNINNGGTKAGRRKGLKICGRVAERALSIFEANPDDTKIQYVYSAHTLAGFADELSESWLSAALHYQNGRIAAEAELPRDHPLVGEAIGRWLNARNYLKRKDRLEYAEANGLCKCWPYNDEGKKIRAIERITPEFPVTARRMQSGYALVNFDVSDEGNVENAKILSSFPSAVYDKASLEAIAQWRYEPKTGDEPEAYRKSVIVPFSFFLTQGLSPI